MAQKFSRVAITFRTEICNETGLRPGIASGIMHFQASNVATIYSARKMASVSQGCSIWDATKKVGADDFIGKTVDFANMLRAIENLLK